MRGVADPATEPRRCENPGDAQSTFDALASTDKELYWIEGTTKRFKDGYNWFGARPGAVWNWPSAIFDAFYSWSVQNHVPAMIAETGCLEDPADPGRKAAWFKQADGWLHTHPNVKAFVYFNTTVRWPWFVDTSPQSLEAWRALANDPLLR